VFFRLGSVRCDSSDATIIVPGIRSDVVGKVSRRCGGARVSRLVYVETGSRTLKRRCEDEVQEEDEKQ